MAKDDLAKIHAELSSDHVYVHPSLRSVVSEADEAALQEQITQAEHPTYVVVFPLRDGDTYGGKPSDLLTRLHDEYPEPGIYLSTTTRLEATDYAGVDVEGRQWSIPGEPDGDLADFSVESVVGMEDHPDVPSAMSRTLELLAMDPDELDELHDEVLDKHSAAYRAENPPEEDGWLPGGGITTGVVAVIAAFVAWRVVVSFRKEKQSTPLPKSAMQRIRAARGRELLAQARSESQALGQRIDEAEISPGDDTAAWQAALDHYAAVRRLLGPEVPEELDVVGALVLARRGEDALTHARAGRSWQPEPTCYLNPLHGTAQGDRRIEWEERTFAAPVCAECRTALKKKRVPDIFDVVVRDQPRHYFETDAEPWASSGYGSLEPDLLKLLNRRGT